MPAMDSSFCQVRFTAEFERVLRESEAENKAGVGETGDFPAFKSPYLRNGAIRTKVASDR